MRLYVIRHGETKWNTERRMQGQTDIPLNENGINLAKKIGAAMAKEHVHIDLVISSPLSRARITAELVTAELSASGKKIPLLTDERIVEMSFGDWEGRCIKNPDEVSPEFHKTFHDDPLHCPVPPNAESFTDVVARTKDFYESLCANPDYRDASILISSHGAASRCFMNNFFEDKNDIWRGCIPKNCSVCIVDVKDGVGTVVEMDKMYE